MANLSDLNLLDDRVLVLPDATNENSTSGLYIPEEARKEIHQGTVILCGNGYIHPSSNNLNYHLDILEASIDGIGEDLGKQAIMRHYADMRTIINAPVMKVNVGDKIIYGKFSGTEIEINDIKYILMQQSDIKITIK